MTLDEVHVLTNFSEHEKDYRGRPVQWKDYWGPTMIWLDMLRGWMGPGRENRCLLIRGDHNIGSGKPFDAGKRTAIDATFPDAPYARVMMEMMRLPCSWGVYVGRNIHLDLRETDKLARWMAFKPHHRTKLRDRGLGHMITGESDGWLYMQWSHVLGVKALAVLQQVADQEIVL